MNPDVIQKFKIMFQENLKNANNAAIAINEDLDISIDDVPDILDLASASTRRKMALTLLRRNSTAVNQLKAALQRIESGDFGYCAQCGCEIDMRRLEAKPTALNCIRCQVVVERYEQRGTFLNVA